MPQDTPARRRHGKRSIVAAEARPRNARGEAGRGACRCQKDWPTWAIVATQVGILVGILAFWEICARRPG